MYRTPATMPEFSDTVIHIVRASLWRREAQEQVGNLIYSLPHRRTKFSDREGCLVGKILRSSTLRILCVSGLYKLVSNISPFVMEHSLPASNIQGVIVLTTQLLALGLRKIRQPKVIAEVIGGILLGLHSVTYLFIHEFTGFFLSLRTNCLRSHTRFHRTYIPHGFPSLPLPSG